MQVRINGSDTSIDRPMTFEELLVALGYDRDGVAVARNQEFVPRSRHETDRICDGDEIEIVSPRQGG